MIKNNSDYHSLSEDNFCVLSNYFNLELLQEIIEIEMSEKNIKDQQPSSRPRSQSMSSQNTYSQTTNERASQESEHGRGMNLEEVINEELSTVPTVEQSTIGPSTIGPSTPQYYESESETYFPISPYSDTIYSKPSVVASGIETKITDDPYILMQEYNRLDKKIDDFFFERVDGMFEYILFLILYKYLGIFGPYQKNIDDASSIYGEHSSITGSVSGEETPKDSSITTTDIDVSPLGNFSTIGGADISNNNDNKPCFNNFKNTEMKNIQIIKLYKELNHDFKNLNDMSAIREFCLEYVEKYSVEPTTNDEFIKNLYKSIKNSSGDEWNFYTSILEYFSEGCEGFNDLTMIRYKSRTNKETDEKEYIIRDINSYPSGETSYSNLFVVEDFMYRFQDNGTNDEVLSKLVQIEEGVDFKSSIQVIQNAPSLVDPATVHPINMSKFYPINVQGDLFAFQKCQDLNNTLDPNNAIIQEIMKSGINQFFSYFGVANINIEKVNFIVFQDKTEIDFLSNSLYTEWLTTLNNQTASSTSKNCPFYYNGIRISIVDRKREGSEINNPENKMPRLELEQKGGANSTFLDLHVGDISIPNITELINSGYYKDSSISTYLDPNGIQIIIDSETKQLWNRVVNLAKYIKDNSSVKETVDEMSFLRFIIISLKSFGDSFQVYYSTAIQQNNDFFPDISKKTYLSSSDKNTGAEKMLYASPFLLNGCGIHPYQGLQERFPAFFKDELSGDEMVDRGDIGSKHGNNYKLGSSKAILTNIKSGGKDYKRYVQILSNQIVGIVEKNQNQNEDMLNIIIDASGNIINLNYDAIHQWSINPPLEDAENVSKLLQVIYNKLKIYQENDNELDNKITVFLEDFEKQEEYLTRLIDVNRSPTTEELQTLIDNLDKDPNEGGLVSDLRALISKATNTIIPINSHVTSSSSSSSSTPPLSTSDKMMNKFTEFIKKVKDSVGAIKIKLTQFIKKLEVEKPSRPSRREYGMSGLMEILTSKVKKYTAIGGRNKTIKNRKIYLKKCTRRNGIRSNKKTTRNNNRQTKNPRKTIKK